MSESAGKSKTRICISFVVLTLLVFGAYVAGEKLGERKVHTEVIRAFRQFFPQENQQQQPEEMNDMANSVDPFSEDPFGNQPSSDPFGGNLAEPDPFAKVR